MNKKLLPLSYSLLLLSFGANAQEAQQNELGIGLAVISQNAGYDIGAESNVVPALLINYGDFSLLGPEVKYNLHRGDEFTFDLTGSIRLDGYSADDDKFFTGMKDRDSTIDLGFALEYELGPVDVGFSMAADVLGKHEGYQAGLTFGHNFKFESTMLTPFIGLEYQSEELVDYYYGVRQEEVTTTRDFYQADAATQAVAGLRGMWWSGPHHRVIFRLEYSVLGSSIEDSPLVDGSNSYEFIMGYAYVF
ncbi:MULTISPECIES: MipA/OmpV family protein [Pseudoalteromonas]|uniref:MipA/OmpV family protein n=1 Tax=Pseudoalteromonas TaxID=53246 RepID=UPI0007DB6712|nr:MULTISPECIES: MipA/OmpV family protein [Pseudoalteromonas]NMR25814.1 MipA/OmpV family protein [Pseudoalteromonas sp. NEC-BIFX-2020_015]